MSLQLPEISAWEWVSIPSVVQYQEGPGVRKHQYTEGGVKLLNGSNINNNVLDLGNTVRYVGEEEAYGRYSHFLVDEGDLLIASSGITLEKFDKKIAYAHKEHLPLCMNTSTIRFKTLDHKKLDLDYFKQFLSTNLFKKQLGRLITGSAQLNFGPSHLAQMFVPLPPLEEQKRIAAILDKGDAIRRKRQQAIELADQFLRSVFLDMFGDPVVNPKGHRIVPLGSVCEKITDGTHHSPKAQEEGIPYITARHVKSNNLDFYRKPTYVSPEAHEEIYSRCNPIKGDVLYIKDGATTGAAAINYYNFEFSMLSSLALIKPNQKIITSEYLCDWLNIESNRERILRNVSGAAITRLTIRKIKDLLIEVPDISSQVQYTSVRTKILNYIEKEMIHVNTLEELFDSLTQHAFKGELTSTKAA